MSRLTRFDRNRFWLRVDKCDDDECWNWLGCLNTHGYGSFGFRQATIGAHRISYEINKGTIPEGRHICHSCDNKRCVNPKHLFLGSHTDNMADATAKGLLGHKPAMNADDVKLMKQLRSDGMTFESISSLFRCCSKTVRNYMTGARVPTFVPLMDKEED